ncbi:hypothetical protein F4803DRAFT_395976 [Xylaria telfairii]|nr:hypothetical protein F4803DRAFT_395976 [Xylaria telfairii]
MGSPTLLQWALQTIGRNKDEHEFHFLHHAAKSWSSRAVERRERETETLAGVQYVQSRTIHFRTGYQFYRTSNSLKFCAFCFVRFGTTSMESLRYDWAKPESCSQHSLLQLSSATRRNGRPLSALLPTPAAYLTESFLDPNSTSVPILCIMVRGGRLL